MSSQTHDRPRPTGLVDTASHTAQSTPYRVWCAAERNLYLASAIARRSLPAWLPPQKSRRKTLARWPSPTSQGTPRDLSQSPAAAMSEEDGEGAADFFSELDPENDADLEILSVYFFWILGTV